MAKWSDLADWRGPTTNQGGHMVEVRGVVLHIAEGSYEGTISWQKNPSADVSSHFIAAKDGRAAQMVDTGTTAWTQKAGNGHWLSIENEGSVPDKLSSDQCEFAAQILARAHTVYGVPLQVTSDPDGKGLGHHSMGSHPGYADDWGHSQCPGTNIINQKAAIVARAKEIVEGTVPLTKEDAELVVKTLLDTQIEVSEEWCKHWPDDADIQDGKVSVRTCLRSGYLWNRLAEDLEAVNGGRATAILAQLPTSSDTPLPPAGTEVSVTGALTLTPAPAPE